MYTVLYAQYSISIVTTDFSTITPSMQGIAKGLTNHTLSPVAFTVKQPMISNKIDSKEGEAGKIANGNEFHENTHKYKSAKRKHAL